MGVRLELLGFQRQLSPGPSWESLVHPSCSCSARGTSALVLPASSCEGTPHLRRLHSTSLQLRGSDPRDKAAAGPGAQRAHNFP